MISFEDFALEVHPALAPRGDSTARRPILHPWQIAAAERCSQGQPPDVIALPTGAGKTMVVDILLWALACQAERPAAERTVGTRIVWAIDRRVLVDEVHDHAVALAQRLGHALNDQSDGLHETAARLASLAAGGPPLVATRWRGGIDERPEREGPLQPQVITSTVAQIGSRLLFRGFGVGRRSVALEAGLCACDTTICLDEAHLVEPFVQTAQAICETRRRTETETTLPGLNTIVITATPPAASGSDVLRLTDADRRSLGARWSGRKRASLLTPKSTRDADCVAALAEATSSHVDDGAMTVACILNTVRRAREVFAALTRRLAKQDVDICLLIGPQRPADREAVLTPDRRRALFEGAKPERPLVVVATQTFEVGLDADVAAMVTESASASALVQRLGRLNRRGMGPGSATIVRDEGSWLYGEDEATAWQWLSERVNSESEVDASVAALNDDPGRPAPKPAAPAPDLTDAIVERLVQTDPRPHRWSEPDVEAFMRGVRSRPTADAALCWRCDLRLDGGQEGVDYSVALMKAVPPQRRELLSLELDRVRDLIRARVTHSTSAARAALEGSDLEGETGEMSAAVPAGAEGRARFLVVRGGEVTAGAIGGADTGQMNVDDLRPGDVIVLPCDLGGVDEHGLAPKERRATDVAGDLASQEAGDGEKEPVQTRPLVPVRITPEALREALDVDMQETIWRSVAHVCEAAERKLSEQRTEQGQHGVVAALVARLHELLPAHQGIIEMHVALQKDNAIGEDMELLSIVPEQTSTDPLDPESVELLDSADLDAEDEAEGGSEVGAAGDTDSEAISQDDGSPHRPVAGEGSPLRRVWVIAPVGKRRDEAPRRTAERRPPTLNDHAESVCRQVGEYAERLALAETVEGSLKLAARVHDHGKADPRFQAFYREGVQDRREPIAKSEFGTRDRSAEWRARARSGLPLRLRHEIGSVAALTDAVSGGRVDEDGCDLELALHLVATHHGIGRPVPYPPDGRGVSPSPFLATAAGIDGHALGDGLDGWDEGRWLERYWRVVERYGPWGVAYLEALLISADRLVSANGG